MILVDSSVWINHFRKENEELVRLLKFNSIKPSNEVVCHPLVIGEVTVGSIGRRKQTMNFLYSLSSIEAADHHQVIRFVNDEKLYTTGLNFVDCHLLLSTLLNEDLVLWTHDKQLAQQPAETRIIFLKSESSTEVLHEKKFFRGDTLRSPRYALQIYAKMKVLNRCKSC